MALAPAITPSACMAVTSGQGQGQGTCSPTNPEPGSVLTMTSHAFMMRAGAPHSESHGSCGCEAGEGHHLISSPELGNEVTALGQDLIMMMIDPENRFLLVRTGGCEARMNPTWFPALS